MKAIRRSLRDKSSPPNSAGSVTSNGTHGHHVLGNGYGSGGVAPGSTLPVSRLGQGKTPPKKVIRAIASYKSRSPTELSFETGDFFHVVGERGGQGTEEPEWFDAANPLTGARGLVPASLFQVLGRNEKENSARSGTPVGFAPAGMTGPGTSSTTLVSPTGNGYGYPQASSSTGQRTSGASTNLSPSSANFPQHRSIDGKVKRKHQPLYGVVQYDFRAERADELDAKKGESIIVIAQSNHEWFVAKPIGRLGGPGLIPVSFVAISDTSSGEPLPAEKVREMIESGMVPPVEEWKKMTAEYKQASIPLGRFEFSTAPQPSGQAAASSASLPYSSHSANNQAAISATSLGTSGSGRQSGGQGMTKAFSPNSSSASLKNQPSSFSQQYQKQGQSTADVGVDPYASQISGYPTGQDSVGYENAGQVEEGELGDDDIGWEKYGLVTSATVESFHAEEENDWFHLRASFQSGHSLILYRLYDDFLEFQYALMDEFVVEAGKALPEGAAPGSVPKRIIPRMPGPVDLVDEVVCAQRVDDLTIYLKGLCTLPEYMRGHQLFFQFFVPRPGDMTALEPDEAMQRRWEAEKARFREQERELAHSASGQRQKALDEEVVEYLDRMQGATDQLAKTNLNGSVSKHSDLPPLKTSAASSGPFAGYSMSNPNHQRQTSQQQRPYSQLSNDNVGFMSPTSQGRQSEAGQLPSAGSGINFISPFATSASSSVGGHMQNQSLGGSQQPPFVKIKIFHRNTDDLIAIRVPPNINLEALLDKVRERLGGDVSHIRYRDEGGAMLSASQSQNSVSMPGGARLIELRTDRELDDWIASSQKLVAYVD